MRRTVGMPQPDNILDVVRLSVRFGKSQVLNNLTFSVPRGTSLAIIGPNGVGKTVLLRTLIGSIQAEGTIDGHQTCASATFPRSWTSSATCP